MSYLVPDYVLDSIYEVTPELLRQNGVRGVLLDLDGTIVSHKTALPPDSVRPFLETLLQSGLRVIVFSNNHKQRVERFCAALSVPFISHAGKPFRRGFRLAAEQMRLPLKQIAVVGDQIFTDVLGGNRSGAVTFYVHTLDRHFFWVDLRYRLEARFIRRGRRQMEERKQHE